MDDVGHTIRMTDFNQSGLKPVEASEEVSGDNTPVLSGEIVTITGTLASMTHEQAYLQISEHGGQPVHHISRHTTLLIVGEEGWPLEEDGKPSVKLQQAESLIHEGFPIRVVSESDWLQMLQLSVENVDVKRLYTPAMLSQLLKIPVQVIRSWERAGLIRAEKKIFRLPYFSYQEVTTARRLSELMQAGATQQQLSRSLKLVQKYLQEPGRAFEQLEMLSDHRQLVMKDEHGYFEPQTRQRLFSFDSQEVAESDPDSFDVESFQNSHLLKFVSPDPDSKTAKDWMVEGCRRAEVSDTSGAIRCFRKALRIRPNDAEAHFYLADALYRLGKPEAALERYLSAIEHDPEYLESWTQIGCLYTELRKFNQAIEAFDEAIAIHPAYAEAHLQKAETLYQMQDSAGAIHEWQKYLEYDERGPWAELAFQRLEQFGIEFSEE